MEIRMYNDYLYFGDMVCWLADDSGLQVCQCMVFHECQADISGYIKKIYPGLEYDQDIFKIYTALNKRDILSV